MWPSCHIPNTAFTLLPIFAEQPLPKTKFGISCCYSNNIAGVALMARACAKAKAIDLKRAQTRLTLAAVSGLSLLALLLLIRP
jgi:hypothetical protein